VVSFRWIGGGRIDRENIVLGHEWDWLAWGMDYPSAWDQAGQELEMLADGNSGNDGRARSCHGWGSSIQRLDPSQTGPCGCAWVQLHHHLRHQNDIPAIGHVTQTLSPCESVPGSFFGRFFSSSACLSHPHIPLCSFLLSFFPIHPSSSVVVPSFPTSTTAVTGTLPFSLLPCSCSFL